MSMRIELDDDKTGFIPSETLRGRVIWKLENRPTKVRVRLMWTTSGQEETEQIVIESVAYDGLSVHGAREFTMKLPAGPYSYRGTLFTLLWGIEGVAEPGGETVFKEIYVSPSRQTIDMSGAETRLV